MGSKIQHGRCHHPHIDHINAASLQTFRQRLRQLHSGQPAITSYRQRCQPALPRFRTDRLADAPDNFGRKRLPENAANIVRLENLRWKRLYWISEGQFACSELVEQ